MAPDSSAPIAWTIAGSDSGGGAGIQADLKVMSAFGVHGCSVITALTAQNTMGVLLAEPVSEAMLREQLRAVASDLPPTVIKTGMLGSVESCGMVADFLEALEGSPTLVCDPVMVSTSGSSLLDTEARDIMIKRIFPRVDILTPNLFEAGQIIGSDDVGNAEDAAKQILETGVRSVLIKGGHAEGNTSSDYWTDGRNSMWLTSPRLDTNETHGTGCILSSAIASAIALGQEIPDAVVIAKTFLNQCIKNPANVGAGPGPIMIEPFRNDPADRPQVVGGGVDSAPKVVAGSADPGLKVVGGNADPGLKVLGGGVDPAPTESASSPPATMQNPASPPPATNQHSHLRRLSKIFVDDPAYFITTCTKGRLKILDNPMAHQILREEWDGAFDRYGWAIGSYVVMPDHVHFFCKPTPDAGKLSELMQHWKEWTSKRIKQELNIEGSVWQEEFFDHLLRSHESYSEKWNYVEQNPVRAGFVQKASDWPYAGCIHYK